MSYSHSFGYKSYTEIYNDILSALRDDNVDHLISVVTAKRLSDAVWDLHLVLNSGKEILNTTSSTVKDIIKNRPKGREHIRKISKS